MIQINPVETNKCCIAQPSAVKNGILPKLPSSYLIIGRSGSGKSTVLYNLLTSEDLLGNYFDLIVVFSPVKTDDILAKLKLPKENYINTFDEDRVNQFLDAMEKKIEKEGMNKVAKTCKLAMIFDDILQKQKFLKSTTMTKLITTNRHFCTSVFVLSQYIRSIPPVIRQNVSGVIFFPSSMMEIEKLADENCEPNMTKKQFISLVEHATKDKHSFLFINRKAEAGERIRKGFDTKLSLS